MTAPVGDPEQILPRAMARLFPTALETARVVVVTGPRQAGKSTFVQTHAATRARPYFTLDDAGTLLRIEADRQAFLRSEPLMVIDEVQRDPALLLAIKAVVDAERPAVRGQFVVTGSANLLLMQRVGDSLAGRAIYLHLWPLARREQLGFGSTGIWTQLFESAPADWLDLVRADPAPSERWEDAVRRGGFPAVVLHATSDEARALWFDAYIATYLERDLRDLRLVSNLRDFQSLMRASALRVGNLLNAAELARDVSLPPSTVHQFLNVLETSYQAVRLEPYARNRTTRLIKTPKLYWSDTGLALALSGGAPTGTHLENYILTDLLAWRDTEAPRPEVSYWRTASGAEVDFIVERRQRLVAVEVKATPSPGPRDVAHLRRFLDDYGSQVQGGLILHGGEQSFWLGDRILATPWWSVV